MELNLRATGCHFYQYLIYLSRRDGRLSWPRWLVTYWDALPAHRRSPDLVYKPNDVALLYKSSLSYEVSLAMWDHSVTCQLNTPSLNPRQIGFIYLPRMDRRLGSPRWLVTYRSVVLGFIGLRVSMGFCDFFGRAVLDRRIYCLHLLFV